MLDRDQVHQLAEISDRLLAALATDCMPEPAAAGAERRQAGLIGSPGSAGGSWGPDGRRRNARPARRAAARVRRLPAIRPVVAAAVSACSSSPMARMLVRCPRVRPLGSPCIQCAARSVTLQALPRR